MNKGEYWDIPRIPENDHIYHPDEDEKWDAEEKRLTEEEYKKKTDQ